jgi:hypothetical protein
LVVGFATDDHSFHVVNLPSIYPGRAMLARAYQREGISNAELWHTKLGHISGAKMKRLKIPGLSVPAKFRCNACIHGKFHRNAHPRALEGAANYDPGECIHTDHRGPYSLSRNGERYSQLFIDIGSNYRWCVRMRKRSGAGEAFKKVLADVSARSGRRPRFIRTDGDGVFMSEEFENMVSARLMIHERSAPNDHNTNPIIERGQRTILEGTATALLEAGAPASFWGEAEDHLVFTLNNIPSREVKVGEGLELWSSRDVLEGRNRPFRLKYLQAFGTAAVCYLPIKRRTGPKEPAQAKSP